MTYEPQSQQPAPPPPTSPAPTAKRNKWPWIIGGAVAIILALCIGGIAILGAAGEAANDAIEGAQPEIVTPATEASATATEDATQPAGPPPDAALGEPLAVTSDILSINYTVTKAEQKTRDDFGTKPEKGVWLLVHAKVDLTTGEHYACSCEFAVVDASGKVYEEAFGSFEKNPLFESADLKSGQNTDGWVVFDLPKKAAQDGKVQLTIQNWADDNAYGYWKL